MGRSSRYHFYVNFTSASKTENNGNDVTIKNADSSLYNPYTGLAKIKDYVYKYTVDSENSGNKKDYKRWVERAK